MWRTALRNLNPTTIAALVAAEREAGTTWRQKLRAWRHGFTSASYRHYRLDEHDPRDYLPDTAVHRHVRAVGPYQRVLRDKVLFAAVAGAFARVPQVVAIVAAGRWLGLTPGSGARDPAAWLDGGTPQAVILKPCRGGRGRGIHRLEHDEDGPALDGRRVTRAEALTFLGSLDDYVAVEAVASAPYSLAVFPGAVNTMRIMTIIDPADGQPFIVAAVHRFGVQASAPADNASRGGVVAKVDLVTGELGPLWRDPKRPPAGPFDRHPETNALVAGLRVPGWDGVQRAVLDLARALDFLLYVGWDVALTPEGPVFLEGNHGPDRGIQRHYPFLADPRARRFFEYHGTIAPRDVRRA